MSRIEHQFCLLVAKEMHVTILFLFSVHELVMTYCTVLEKVQVLVKKYGQLDFTPIYFELKNNNKNQKQQQQKTTKNSLII